MWEVAGELGMVVPFIQGLCTSRTGLRPHTYYYYYSCCYYYYYYHHYLKHVARK